MKLTKSLWTKLITVGLGATMAFGVGLTASKIADEVQAASQLLNSYNFLDGGSSSNSAYASTDLDTNVSYAADNPGGTSGTTAWEADYANLSMTSATRLGGKLESTVQTDNTTAWANIKTTFTFTPIIEKVEIIGVATFGTAGNTTNLYLQSSTTGTTWTTQASTTTKSGTITFDSLTIPTASYLRFGIALKASGTNSGIGFTGIKVYKQSITLSSIAVTTPPTLTAYYAGDTFNRTGMVVTASFSDSSSSAVSYDASGTNGYNYSTSALVAGATIHTISYTFEGVTKTANVTISVTAVVLSSISISGTPTKTTYLVGQSFDPTGITVTATRNNGSTANVTSSTTFTPDPLTAGTTSVTASYTEGAVTKTATISGLTVNNVSLVSISVSGTPNKTSYYAGENFVPTGVTITAHYDDSSSRVLGFEEVTFAPTPLTAGTTSVTVTFDNGVTEKSTTISGLTVTAVALNSITIKTPASKTNFKLGETFSYSGLVINANYNSGTVEKTSGFSVTGVDTMVLGTQMATVSFESKTVTYSVDVTNQGAAVSYTIPGVASDLFISEYVEGSSGTNKALEIYNGTGSTIDLSVYSLKIGTNGGSLGNTLALSGSLANGEVYVVYNNGADLSDITANGDLVNNTIANFNGDDSIGLFNDGTLIDLIGVEGTDPGSAWTSGTKSTANQALRRAASVSSPNTTFTWAEWESYADSASNLSTHVMDLDDILVPGDVTAQQQATAFANYVMTGIGLNAQGSCAAVKSELDAEYGYMAASSKSIFDTSSDTLFVNARARMDSSQLGFSSRTRKWRSSN